MNNTFKKSDIINQEKLRKDIDDTYGRLMKNPKRNLNGRKPETMRMNTEMGLVLEHYLMQNDHKFEKATDLDPGDVYHDLIDTTVGEIHECKARSSYKSPEQNFKELTQIILGLPYNHSKYLHLALYDNKTETYTYHGFKQIR